MCDLTRRGGVRYRLIALMIAVAALSGSAFASVVKNGSTITFDVAEGLTETYEQAIPTDGSVNMILKKGLGTMRMTETGGPTWKGLTVDIAEGVLELENNNALGNYNFIKISKGAQLYFHCVAPASHKSYAPFYHDFTSVAGHGPDGTGAIRVDSSVNLASCFRSLVNLSGDATFTMDVNTEDGQDEAGFGANAVLNLNGYTLTLNGHSKTVFHDPIQWGTQPPRVTPGDGGKMVLNTLRYPIIDKAEFEGDALNVLSVNQSPLLKVTPTAVFPWTVVSENDEQREVSYGWFGHEAGTFYLLGKNTMHWQGDAIVLGAEGQTGKGATMVVGPGAKLCQDSAGREIRSQEQGPIPALYRVEAGAIVSNRITSTWGNAKYKLATHNWGEFWSPEYSYLGNWSGLGFFALEDGKLHIASSGSQLLGVPGSRGVFQQDGGVIAYEGDSSLSRGGRSDFLMRGGSLASTTGCTFYLASSNNDADKADDLVTFSLVGPGNPLADLNGALNLNSRTGVVSFVNLNAGRLVAKTFLLKTSTSQNPSYVNLNGGTLVMPENAWSYLCWKEMTPRMTTVYENGVTFELNRPGRTFMVSGNDSQAYGECSYPLRGAFGKGVKVIRLPSDMPRTGYRGIMPVKIASADGDTTGEGALAALDFNVATGEIGPELLILCHGCGYTQAPQVIAYGPDFETPYICEVELTDEDQVPGPFVKTGVGELMLNSSDNTYAGPYIVSNGTLMVNKNAQIPATSKVFLAGGCFRWDWCDRTVAEFGGYGTFFGSRNNAPNKLVVTDALTFDADDLNKGRYLSVDQNSDDGTNYAKDDFVDVGSGCRVVIRDIDALDPDIRSFVLIRQSKPFSSCPSFDGDMAELRVTLRKKGTELCLVRNKSLRLIIR